MKNFWNPRRFPDPARRVLTPWGKPLAPFPKPNLKSRVQLRRGQANSLRARVEPIPVTPPRLAFLMGAQSTGEARDAGHQGLLEPAACRGSRCPQGFDVPPEKAN